MDLKEVLLKTKKKGQQSSHQRSPVYVATDDRPYNLNDSPNDEAEIKKEIANKVTTKWQQPGNLVNAKLDKDEAQSIHKPNTNYTQSKHKTQHKLYTNYTQAEGKNKLIKQNQTQTIHTTLHKTQHNSNTNHTQTLHKKLKEKPKEPFSSFTGLQRKILIFIYQSCKVNRSRETQELTTQHIANTLNIKAGSIKTSIKRLEQKEAIKQTSFKNGRGGWTKYELQEHISRDLILIESEHKPDINYTQTIHKPDTQLYTQPNTNLSSSSSYINNKTTTTDHPKNVLQKSPISLPPEWEGIDISSLGEIGLTKTHLLQFVQQNKLSPEIIQDSIHAFAFDLAHNNKLASIKGSPLNYFMGIIRQGLPYAFPENYESPQQESLRKYYESKKALELKQVEIEKELMEAEFSTWLGTLTETALNELVPTAFRRMELTSQPKQAALREHFKNKEWPKIKNNVMSIA